MHFFRDKVKKKNPSHAFNPILQQQTHTSQDKKQHFFTIQQNTQYKYILVKGKARLIPFFVAFLLPHNINNKTNLHHKQQQTQHNPSTQRKTTVNNNNPSI